MTYQAVLAEAWRAHLAPRAADAPTVVSLFAGCGGSSLGYSMAGFRELLAVEWDVKAAATFRANFPGVPMHVGDICALTDDEALRLAGVAAGDLDVLDGSPPCQGFSTAGKRQMDDPRNGLFREHVRLLRAFRPRAFVMENVSGLVKGKMRLAFAEITAALKEAGYRVACRLVDASWLGVPQKRQRLIWIGIRNDIGRGPLHPSPRGPRLTVQEAFSSGEADLMADTPAPPLTGKTRVVAEALRQGWSGDMVTGGSHYSYVRLRWDATCPTIDCHPLTRIHPTELRGLSVSEVKRLQSFPDEFSTLHPWAIAWAQVGNSVPPLMMRAIAEQVRATLDGDGRPFAEVAAERRRGDDAPPDPPK